MTRRVVLPLVLCLLTAAGAAAEKRLSKEDILTLLQSGFGEELIIRKIRATGIAFEPTVSTMVELKNAGATDRILAALIDGSNPGHNSSLPASVPQNDLVLIPAGPFEMGARGKGDFSPSRTVYVDSFYIDPYEVTNVEYEKFDPTHRRDPSSECDRCPVTNVSWQEAESFARSLGKRLPTEAEWEKAARGPEGLLFGYGADFRKDMARLDAPSAAEAGSYPPNGYGLYDMLGNVWEWCADSYSPKAYRQLPDRNPRNVSGAGRVMRGGSFRNGREIHLAARTWSNPNYRYRGTGFRCAKDGPREAANE